MDQIVSEYRKLLNLLAEENQQAALCLQGELLEIYRNILMKEQDQIEQSLRALQQISIIDGGT